MSLPVKFDEGLITECAAEVMVYFERHKLMEIVTRVMAEISLVRPPPESVQLWIATNIKRIANEIYQNCLNISFNEGFGEVKFYELPGRYLHRVVIFGRRGSGRKSQALALVKRFNLIFIDAEQIIYHHLHGSDELSKQLQHAFENDNVAAKSQALAKLLCRRILQMDALRYGWVMVNYPNNLIELQELFERFKVPPNRLVYLQCPAIMALRRLVAQPNLGRPQDNCEYMHLEMQYFNSNENEMNAYLARRHETVYVDATPCFDAVKTNMLFLLDRRPYVMGFKY